MTPERAYWIDDAYDRDRASDGVSRYDSYLRLNLHEFDDAFTDKDPADFAATAWRIATGPIMAPGYVRQHPRIISTRLFVNYEDGALVASVGIVTGPPLGLAKVMSRPGVHWQSWPTAHGQFYKPEGDDLTRDRRYLLTSTEAVFSLPRLDLPAVPRGRHDGVEAKARAAVRLLAEALDETVSELITVLEVW